MKPNRRKLTALLVGFIGILGLLEFSQPFLRSSVSGFQELLVVKLPFVTSLCLLVSSYGFFVGKRWALKTAEVAFLLWICTGIAASYFSWTFHPWGQPALIDRLRGIRIPTFFGVIAPLLLWTILRRLKGTER